MKALTFSGPFDVLTLISVPPGRFFRHVLPMTFTVGSVDERIAIDSDATHLDLRFTPFDYNAVSAAAPLTAALEPGKDNFILVSLDAPRQVVSVSTSIGFFSPGFDQVLTKRAPRLLAPSTSSVSSAFQISFHTVDIARVDGAQPAGKPTVTVQQGSNLDQDFVDARFGVRLKNPQDQVVALAVSNLKEIAIRSYPTGPRLGIADAAISSPPVLFFQSPGEIRPGAPGDKGHVQNVGAAFIKQLQSFLDGLLDKGLTGPFPQTIVANLVIESDSPCHVNIAQLDVTYHRVIQSFDGDPKDKRVVHLTGDPAPQEVSIRLPRGAGVASANLKVVESFGPGGPPAAGSTVSLNAPPAETTGALAELSLLLAQDVTPQTPLRATGIALGLLPLEAQTTVLMELREDSQGQPSGQKLAEGKLELSGVAEPAWRTLLFSKPVVLQTQTYWITLRVARGLAVWLGHPVSSSRALRQFIAGNLSSEAGVIEGQQLLVEFLSEDAQPGAAGWTVSVGSQTLQPSVLDQGARTVDMAAALTSFLQGAPGSQVVVPVRVTSAISGILTLNAPRVLFDA